MRIRIGDSKMYAMLLGTMDELSAVSTYGRVLYKLDFMK